MIKVLLAKCTPHKPQLKKKTPNTSHHPIGPGEGPAPCGARRGAGEAAAGVAGDAVEPGPAAPGRGGAVADGRRGGETAGAFERFFIWKGYVIVHLYNETNSLNEGRERVREWRIVKDLEGVWISKSKDVRVGLVRCRGVQLGGEDIWHWRTHTHVFERLCTVDHGWAVWYTRFCSKFDMHHAYLITAVVVVNGC